MTVICGGLIAYEMARQLQQQGKNVNTLLLIDSTISKEVYFKSEEFIVDNHSENKDFLLDQIIKFRSLAIKYNPGQYKGRVCLIKYTKHYNKSL